MKSQKGTPQTDPRKDRAPDGFPAGDGSGSSSNPESAEESEVFTPEDSLAGVPTYKETVKCPGCLLAIERLKALGRKSICSTCGTSFQSPGM